jgi:two-component system nitrogen regulation sensor histidine kinase NtrY
MKRFGLAFFLLLFIIVLLSSIELHFMRLETLSITTKVILLILLNVNIIALLTLMFFVAKTFVKLYLERRQKVLGSRFKTKIVVIFVVLTSIPSVLLFLASSGLVTNYIDRWFTPQFRQPIDSTLYIAKAIYETKREKTLDAARAIMSKGPMPDEYKVIRLAKVPDNPSDVMLEAFEGREGTEVISGDDGDTVRAVVPDRSKGGVIVVESYMPKEITRNVEKIKSAYEDYIKLEAWKQPLKFNYLLFLGFFTLIVIFTALWVSLRIARGITDPIQSLVQATEEVASGNLDVNVTIRKEDEIGLLISSFNDMVNKLRNSEETLKSAYAESNRRRLGMENIVDNIKSGVISLDVDGNIIAINNSACSILNIPAADVINRNYKEILALIRSDSLQEMVRGLKLRTLGSVEKDLWVNVGGKRALLKVTITGLRHESSYLGLLVVFEDLTETVRAQKAIAWQEVARRIAHEIKNPLTPIKLSAERMLKKWEHKDEDFNQVFERSAKSIIKEVDSLRRLVDDFSKYGKMPEINKSPTSLAGIIDEVVNLYREFKNYNIRTSVPHDLPLIDMDGEQFKRVMINLFDNAMQAMSNGGNIDVMVSLDRDSNRVFIDVADDGPGIKEEDKEKLFLPYFSTKSGGTGLGLAIASKIIRDHMGFLRVNDNEPKGTVFVIDLPIKEV